MEDTLQQLEETYGAPASLFERSAAARAKISGETVEAVLQEWAGRGVAGAESAGTSRQAPVTSSESPDAGPEPPGASPQAPVAGPEPATSTGLSGAALLTAVAKARGMPESLIERSAMARAKAAGVSLDDVLHEWAEEEGLEVAGLEVAGSGEVAGRQTPDASSDQPDAGAEPAVSTGLSGAALLTAVAKARGMPESLTERSAKARAKKENTTVDDVLAVWAVEAGLEGAGPGEVAGRQTPDANSEAPDASSETPVAGAVPTSPPGASSSAPLEGGPGADDGDGQTGEGSDDSADPTATDPVQEPDPESEPSPRSRYPAWLAAAIVLIPLLAVLYLVIVPNQPSCGSAGQLTIDPASGNAVGCDGSEYGADRVSNFAVGSEIYGASCAVCHGTDGGGGAGPAMAGGVILETFPEGSCTSHVEWVALGSAGWPDSTYGENATPVAGGMPGFGGQLSDLEVSQVSLYERVQFGGLDLEAAEAECGLESVSEEG
jgi:mono/diheme cytochrome c family protein